VSGPADSEAPDQTAPRTGAHWPTIWILAAIYTYAFVDRHILALLVEPIRRDLNLTDVQMGNVMGLAFGLFYALLNIPAGYLVDRVNRRAIIGGATSGWSVMTVVCGMAGSYGQMFLGRAGVGLAEAAIAPAAFSMIRGSTSPSQRGRAFSIFGMAPYLGKALAMIAGGALLALAAKGAFASVPWLGTLEPWRIVLILAGAFGFPLALLLFFVREPVRLAPAAGQGVRLIDAARHMVRDGPVYGLLIAYVTLSSIVAFGNAAWIPAMLGRRWGLEPSQVGALFGAITLACAPVGLIGGGVILDRLAAAGRDVRLYGLLASAVAMAAYAAAPIAPTLTLTLGLYGFGLLFAGVFYSVGATTLAQITPGPLMGQVTAAYLLLQNLIGQGLGPSLTALLSKNFSGPSAIAYAMSLQTAVLGFASVIALLALTRSLRGRTYPQ